MSLAEVLDYVRRLMAYELFQLGQNPISIWSIAMFAMVLVVFAVASRVVRSVFLDRGLRKLRLDEGTRYTFLRITHYIFLLVGALVAFDVIGINLSGLVVLLGFLSVGIGFGLQNVTSNFISGLILLMERPIRVGDRVTVGEIEGDVTEINIRSTTIRSLNNISVIVPNSEFVSTQVINWSHRDPKVRLDINVGVSYASDLDVVLQSLREVAEEHGKVLRTPPPEVLHMGFGDSSWNMRLRVWIGDPKQHPQVRSDINCAIVHKFRERGVEIPYPQRDLHVRSPLPVPIHRGEGALNAPAGPSEQANDD